jgi:hypothetical protein
VELLDSKGRKPWPSEYLPDSSFAVSMGGFCLSASFVKCTAKGWRCGRRGSSAIVRKTFFFSANWFFASTNICRIFHFKIYEELLLLRRVAGSAKASDPARVPYQMNDAARKSTILFTVRMSLLLCRVLYNTKDSVQRKSALIMDSVDMITENNDRSWSAAEMKTRVRVVADEIEILQDAVQHWCLQVLKQKVQSLYGSGQDARMIRLRPLPSSDSLTCRDFTDSSASELLQ